MFAKQILAIWVLNAISSSSILQEESFHNTNPVKTFKKKKSLFTWPTDHAGLRLKVKRSQDKSSLALRTGFYTTAKYHSWDVPVVTSQSTKRSLASDVMLGSVYDVSRKQASLQATWMLTFTAYVRARKCSLTNISVLLLVLNRIKEITPTHNTLYTGIASTTAPYTQFKAT